MKSLFFFNYFLPYSLNSFIYLCASRSFITIFEFIISNLFAANDEGLSSSTTSHWTLLADPILSDEIAFFFVVLVA